MVRSNSYMCRPCNSAKGKEHYARNSQKYLDMDRERRKTEEGCEKKRIYASALYEKNKEKWVGYRETQKQKENTDPWVRAGRMLIWIRRRAAHKQYEFNLTREWIEQRLVQGTCEVTGLAFDLGRNTTQRFNPWCPSIDRIDSSKGYTQDNCRAVVWIYNMAKSEWSDEVVMQFAKALALKST